MIRPFSGNFILTQQFGVNKANYVQFGLQGHNGLDYALPTATQVIAPHDGKVIETGDEGTRGYGRYIKIENTKEGSVMAHLQTFQVKVGDMVSERQPIALSDNTGNSTGPHLHWGYYLFPRNRQNGYAGFINQLPLITSAGTPPTSDLQKQLDEMRKQRDDNWNLYQAEIIKNNVLNNINLELKLQLDSSNKKLSDIKTIVA